MTGLERLNGSPSAPIALALSGGGDSLALLHLAKAWADGAGRELLALTVDHGLQPQSADWSQQAAQLAGRLKVAHRILPWLGEKPSSGLPAAARAARHALLADAARAAGARVILMAHTADDLIETELMRRAGGSTPSPRLWSPSPAWPEGRGVFLLRPLLGHRRAELRSYLAARGERWIDDPANDDNRYARARARRLVGSDAETPRPEPSVRCVGLAEVTEGLGGELTVPRSAIVGDDPPRRLLGALILCAAGTTRPAAAVSLARLAARLSAGEDFTASLAGARIEASGEGVLFCREAGESARGGLMTIGHGQGDTIFDGRFLLAARPDGARVAPLRGLARRLPKDQQARLASLAPPVRRALPAVIDALGGVVCPVFSEGGGVSARSLVLGRLRAALGAIPDEATAAQDEAR
jgi:tRNA(Ile)-lysidine synthase